MKLKFQNRLEVSGRDVVCDLTLSAGKTFLMSGENGVGKTTLITFLKVHQAEFFPKKDVVFVDQFPLLPLNSISFQDLKKNLDKLRFEKLDLFHQLEELANMFSRLSIKELSGGQNQVIKILIALYLSGDVFIFDEPLQYLDEKMRKEIKNVLHELKKLGKTLIIVEHMQDFEAEFIDETISMKIEDDKVMVRNGI